MAITSIKELVAQANSEIITLSTEQALASQTKGEGVLVDIRDIRELGREGEIEGAVHAPRGMLEFWFDPQSPYHREVFGDMSKQYILFCAAGWRSALAAKTLKDMGYDNIAHIDGGFGAFKENGGPINLSDEAK